MATQSQVVELDAELPEFKMKGVDGKTYSRADFDDRQVLVLGITCNHCPYVQAYEERINALAKEFQSQPVAVICVNPNNDSSHPEDSYEAMVSRAKEKGFEFYYLRDADQEFAKSIGAACTPEFFVYGPERKLGYHGRLDDNQDPKQAKTHYIKEVVTALLKAEEPPYTQTHAIGCSVKWK